MEGKCGAVHENQYRGWNCLKGRGRGQFADRGRGGGGLGKKEGW